MSSWIYPLIVILFSLVGMKALFHPGLFTAHDIWHQVVRLYYYTQGVNDGQFPPLWIGQLANHFGYPLFFFSYHLPWIIGVALTKIGLGIFTAIKALFFLSYIASGLTMYFFARNILKDNLSALLSSLLYLWLPYHFLVIFVGASMGVAFVFTFLPLIFLGLHLIRHESKFGIPILAIGLTGVTLSHIMHLVFLLPIILIFTLWEFTTKKSYILFISNISLAIVLGILLSSFYLIPATYYNSFTRVHKEEGITKLYERNFINLKQLVYSKWGYSPIVNNAKNGEISFQLGIAQWISILGIFILLATKKLSRPYKNLSLFLLAGFTLNILLMLDLSKPVWTFLIKYVTIDFPFRFILPAAFIASFLAGIITVNMSKNIRKIIFIFLFLTAIYTNRNHINVNLYTDFPISTYLDLESERTTNTFNEYLPIQADPRLLNKPWNEAIGKNFSAYNTKHTTNSLLFNTNSKSNQSVSLGQFYFPGQTLYIDNKISSFSVNKQGLISVIVPEGNHSVKVIFQETTLIKISKIVTLITALSLLFYCSNAIPLCVSRWMKSLRRQADSRSENKKIPHV